ncbi:NACHT, LRR and PYD domains-containing protein 1 homolog [Sander lucioperca]|uniref:NACHT, LRR and PYD domains-containing protein 1 homolog n=1 Tax=Sander lucioperca TaxID=283035 RepID=UPI00125E2719|nr:NACHT, LRR and PYD domains-containing protein 1 homolog [Sander lucioperca]
METADRDEMVELMVEIYGHQSVEVTREVLMKMNRRDLVQRLSDISSGSKGPSTSLELEGCGSTMQFSSDWTKLQPEVTLTDADEAPTYSLQSEAGIFECSVSGLRWVCKEKVSFKYQFCSWEGIMERMESLQYMPAGPLMDITVIAGKLDEVYLPHWICIDGNPEILDKFAVLHIDDCGDSVEKVSEVTSSHVKLSEPVFSLKMVLVKVGLPVEIHCKVLIYKTNIPFLTLHVYLIPPDPAVIQKLDKTEVSCGNQRILKQHPKNPLKMNDWFILTAYLDSGEMYRDNLVLRYESSEPNFFDLFMKDPDTDIVLTLTQENDHQPVQWTCVILKDEYQSSTGPVQGQHFVNKHRIKLIERVSNIGTILDELLDKDVIQPEMYDKIRVLPTCQDKMRELYSGPLNAAGACKDIFYKILEEKERYLVDELKEKK